MTNGDKIRQMNDQELAEYIYSVYLAGQMKVTYTTTHPINNETVYVDWLKEEVND